MADFPGIERPELQMLPRIADRMSFLYFEHCKVNREDGAITVSDEKGVSYVPAASISVLMLGPGTSITHRAMELIGDAGVSVVWIGEHGVRYYAGGRALTSRSGLLLKQAKMVSNQRLHLNVVKKMYQLRFPDESVAGLTLQQLRGRKGSRIRSVYRELAKEWNVSWNGREYDPDDFSASDTVNQALSAGHACLYGLAHAVITAMGCSPGLGFIHVGHECSFVYDIADLYKAETTIPVAFEITASGVDDLSSAVRRKVRDVFVSKHILERMVHDIHFLFEDEDQDMDGGSDDLFLWDNNCGTVPNGVSYHDTQAEDHGD